MRRNRGEMYSGHRRPCVCLCVCVSVPRCIPTLLHGPGCNAGEWWDVRSSCALLGGFAIGAQVALLSQHSAEREMSASACSRWMPGFFGIRNAVIFSQFLMTSLCVCSL